jgi:hypothetical protein
MSVWLLLYVVSENKRWYFDFRTLRTPIVDCHVLWIMSPNVQNWAREPNLESNVLMLLSLYVCTCQSSFPPMKGELNKVEQGGSSFPKSPKAWPLLGYEAAYSAFPIGDLLLMMGRKLIFLLSLWFCPIGSICYWIIRCVGPSFVHPVWGGLTCSFSPLLQLNTTFPQDMIIFWYGT